MGRAGGAPLLPGPFPSLAPRQPCWSPSGGPPPPPPSGGLRGAWPRHGGAHATGVARAWESGGQTGDAHVGVGVGGSQSCSGCGDGRRRRLRAERPGEGDALRGGGAHMEGGGRAGRGCRRCQGEGKTSWSRRKWDADAREMHTAEGCTCEEDAHASGMQMPEGCTHKEDAHTHSHTHTR